MRGISSPVQHICFRHVEHVLNLTGRAYRTMRLCASTSLNPRSLETNSKLGKLVEFSQEEDTHEQQKPMRGCETGPTPPHIHLISLHQRLPCRQLRTLHATLCQHADPFRAAIPSSLRCIANSAYSSSNIFLSPGVSPSDSISFTSSSSGSLSLSGVFP